ncbi:hypothetical protein EV426DRAFT_618441 [Tirmania nivea]|nr:hypothetical protein EV426DRAFT_618441 [Tirmania nivea]
MSAADVRDVLELPGPSQTDTSVRRPPAKKQKTVEKRPDGITRELYALLGEHPPPVSLSLKPHFKERPRWLEKAKPWEQRAFVNPARGDGLVLRHWVAKRGLNENREMMNVEKAEGDGKEDTTMTGTGDGAACWGSDVNASGDLMQLDEPPSDTDYHFAKFNIKPNILRYTDAEYALITNTKPKSLQDPNTTTATSTAVEVKADPEAEEIEPEGWTRSETDYLFSLCEEYDLRFPIIHDRYNYLPPSNPNQPPSQPPPRSLEDLKYRYYSITQSLLSHRTPIHLMTPQEHQHYTLHSFDRAREVSRKRIAETLFNRTPDEIKEEEFLLAEMKRIIANQEKLLEERQDLWNRLDAPASAGSIAAYMGSVGLGNLGLLVGVGEKGKKRKSIAGGMANIDTSSAAVGAAASGGSGGQVGTPNTAAPTPTISRLEKKHSHSHSISSASGATLRDLKDLNNTIPSTPSATPQSSTFPPPSAARPLSPQSQAHYGVSYPTEKLSSGVYLRSSKIGTVKGASQPKVQAALNELGVPVKLVMSTEKTCKRMEGLNSVVGMVLDARRLLEKLEGELRVERGRLESLG